MLTQNKHGLGVEKVKQFIRDGKIEGEQTEDGYWKVKVYNDECVSKEVFDEEHQKRIEAVSYTHLYLLYVTIVKINIAILATIIIIGIAMRCV